MMSLINGYHVVLISNPITICAAYVAGVIQRKEPLSNLNVSRETVFVGKSFGYVQPLMACSTTAGVDRIAIQCVSRETLPSRSNGAPQHNDMFHVKHIVFEGSKSTGMLKMIFTRVPSEE